MEAHAGSITAHMEDATFYWPDNFTLDLQQALTNGWLWRIFYAMSHSTLPQVEPIKHKIKAHINGQLSQIYKDDPSLADTALNYLLENSREVKYRGKTVAGIVLTPSTQKGIHGMLYFLNANIAPTAITHLIFPLNDPLVQEVVRNGLPEKTIFEFSEKFFPNN
ncbi:MAG: hypothetical protein H7240_00865 [Glaciimonas sp.]|nr:hypothetical protein [Glaciimonas sp.]